MADPRQPRGDVLLEWDFPEFQQHERGRSWYLAFLTIIAGLSVLSFFLGNYTFIPVILLTSFIILIRLRRTPPPVHFAIREEGIEVSARFYSWREIKSFWVLYRPPEIKKLYLIIKGPRPAMDIALVDQNPVKVRQLLSEFILEETDREEEPSGDQISRILKI
jgi:hypothetical protein